MTSHTDTFAIVRTFAFPLEEVWAAWTDATQLGQWWGPAGCTIEVCSLDLREGGFFHYAMQMAGMPTSWGRFNFLRVVPQQALIWLNSFSNEKGGMARAPFSDVCPFEIRNEVRFTQTNGTTTVRLTAAPFGASPEEDAFFAQLCAEGSLEQGYGGTFDRLLSLLTARASGQEAGR